MNGVPHALWGPWAGKNPACLVRFDTFYTFLLSTQYPRR
jgi:hypothetical protein